jgi:hypothetical protein
LVRPPSSGGNTPAVIRISRHNIKFFSLKLNRTSQHKVS